MPRRVQWPIHLLLIPVEVEIPVLNVTVPAPQSVDKPAGVLSPLRTRSIKHREMPEAVDRRGVAVDPDRSPEVLQPHELGR